MTATIEKPVCNFAIEYNRAGLSVVAIRVDGSKRPVGNWKQYQSRIADETELRRMFGNNGSVGVGIIAGKVSGNLEIIDFDKIGVFEQFAERVENELPGLIDRLPTVRTPRMGTHLFYRCETIEGNQKLAQEPVTDETTGKVKPATTIETRGEGGLVVAEGSPEACHPTGNLYHRFAGPPLTEIPTISVAERDVLLDVARSFNLWVDETPQPAKTEPIGPKPKRAGLSPGDDYNARATFDEILTPHRWTCLGTKGDKTEWRRPGKQHGMSGDTYTSNGSGGDVFSCFTDNAHPLTGARDGRPCTTYSKFALFAALNHGGDFSAAAKALAAAGYGEKSNGQNVPLKKDGATKAGADFKSLESTPPDAPCRTTDLGNARRLVRRHGPDIRYCYKWRKWIIWNGVRWEPDESGEIVRRAKDTVGAIYEEAAALGDDARKAMARHAVGSEKRERISAMIVLAESEPGIPVTPNELDQDPWLLNVENGTLDLRSGELRQHQREDYLTKLAPVRYDPDADCPTWLRFIDSTFGGNQSLAEFVRRLFGYCLTGSTRDHVLAFLYGTGANGKSVLLNTTIDVMGPDYAMKAPADFLMIKRGEAHPTERADLFGKRLVAAIEAEEGKRLAESMVKELTGGDKVRARRMREDFWEFDATHKVMLAANHKPTIRGQDPGIWRRILLIPFAVRFWDASRGESGPPELEADKELPEKLLAEKSGILNWLLLGCIDWQAKGLAAPKEVLIETDNYRNEQDVVGRFVDERCLESEEAEATAKELYASFQEWAKQTGEYPLNQRRFGARLTERGYERYKSSGIRYRGLCLTAGF